MHIGIDEVGRGALAGPLYVCAFGTKLSTPKLLVCFPKKILRDSKKLSAAQRETIFKNLLTLKKMGYVSWKIGKVSAKIIDTYGLTVAIEKAVASSLLLFTKEKTTANLYLDGGLHAHKTYTNQKTIIKGDEKVAVIACASIVAKVLRDKHMKSLSKKYSNYGFEQHVGYGTKKHIESIKKHGKTKEHRELFLRNIITKNTNK